MIFCTFSGANLSAKPCELEVRTRTVLKNKIALNLVSFFCTDVGNLILVVVSKDVESETIAAGINRLLQLMLEQFELGIIQDAFKHRVLHACAVGDTLLCNNAQATFSRRRRCVDIIGNQNQYVYHLAKEWLLPQEWWILVHIAANMAG